ncbi:hypothetical protein [Antribacter gilvus]|uniref:hypothetical protein n=1 Tax=Antribacter gilvus TaxID=2304675 RepID=UPI000F7807A2|nr:hypothetical protein [Antribacter gilvus]
MGTTSANAAEEDLHARRRRATPAELDAAREAVRASGRALDPAAPCLVLAYPGVGVGETYPDLAGCTSQLLLVAACRSTLAEHEVDVVAMSTRPLEATALRGMRDVAVRARHDVAARLPHVDLDGVRYLTRFTLVLGGSLDGTIFDEITDVTAHTRGVVDLLVAP